MTKQSDKSKKREPGAIHFSNRTNWHSQPNKLSQLLCSLRKSGKPIYDLTVSNPTDCGFNYPANEILSALANPLTLNYEPDPHGLRSARESVALYYQEKNILVDPENIFLTASTSEAYSIVFKLLCNAGDNIIVPNPSYPLFDYLAQLNDVELHHYCLRYDHDWQVDLHSIKNAINQNTKAIVFINPHNPTGRFIKQNEYREIVKIAAGNNLALIVDEVFIDYAFDEDDTRTMSTAGESEVLTFTLNGISKMIGLPQMKIGWITVGGCPLALNEAKERLEIINDTFLSVNTPVQVALPLLLKEGKTVQLKILERTKSNYTFLHQVFDSQSTGSLLACEGGWYGIIRVPRIKSDEEWALELLEKKGIYVFPGYFFDFEEGGYIVVSLIVKNSIFQDAIKKISEHLSIV